MFSVVVFLGFDFVSSVLAKRLVGKSISKMTYFVTSGTLSVNSVSHFLTIVHCVSKKRH